MAKITFEFHDYRLGMAASKFVCKGRRKKYLLERNEHDKTIQNFRAYLRESKHESMKLRFFSRLIQIEILRAYI